MESFKAELIREVTTGQRDIKIGNWAPGTRTWKKPFLNLIPSYDHKVGHFHYDAAVPHGEVCCCVVVGVNKDVRHGFESPMKICC
jgi:hypothetical protein